MDEELRRSILTPEWIRDRDSKIVAIAKSANRLARLVGVMMALLDHARRHLPKEEWQYILRQLDNELNG